jgi:hypothetical protein
MYAYFVDWLGSIFIAATDALTVILDTIVMPADDALLLIDANKYLDLYRTDKGKKLLAPLVEQVNYIFVTQQIVDEVQRNKVQVAADFLTSKFKELKLLTFNVPDHLTGANSSQGADILKEMGEVVERLRKMNSDVDSLGLGILEQISRSEDEVSVSLASIFANAISHSSEVLERAKARRERGNPPGKITNALGDQITWELVLSNFQGKRRIWVISRDGDYGTIYGGKGFLNRFLYDELQKVSPNSQAFLFSDSVEGIRHFVETTGAKADARLTPEEAREIEKEEQSLDPLPQHIGSTEGSQRRVHLNEEYERLLREFRRPNEEYEKLMKELRRPNEEYEKLMKELRRPNEEYEKLMKELRRPNEEYEKLMKEIRRPNEEYEKLMKEIRKPNEEYEKLMKELRRPNEEQEKLTKDIRRLNDS